MPVKHDLLADLQLTREAFEDHKKKDHHLGSLHARYLSKDNEVVEAERDGSPDDKVTRLRKERLLIKDEIVSHLKP
ncbi:DUF465 domain-containing protein [Pseudomonas sp. Marseille-P9899]|uniref:DUF465 domain-containing protein n=1 Tax=Pseudomonas sp. Marseille-P9899 TaxID=2730401 RepID=UPI00158CFF8F|nr:DUF465 domain-containing protein [Pseudomonas sp. Marseille-P9899]